MLAKVWAEVASSLPDGPAWWQEVKVELVGAASGHDARFQAISTAGTLSCRPRQPETLESPPHILFYLCLFTDIWWRVQGKNSWHQSQEHTCCDTQGVRDGMSNPLNGWGPRARCEEWPAWDIVNAPSLIFKKYPWPRSWNYHKTWEERQNKRSCVLSVQCLLPLRE